MDYLCYIDSFTPILFSSNYFDSHNLPPNTDNFLVSGLFDEDSGQEQLPCSLKAKGKDDTIMKYISWRINQGFFFLQILHLFLTSLPLNSLASHILAFPLCWTFICCPSKFLLLRVSYSLSQSLPLLSTRQGFFGKRLVLLVLFHN